MASSQVEIAPSPRFGHVLRDRNHQPDSYRTSSRDNNSTGFKDLVQTHFGSRRNSGSGNPTTNNNLNQQRMDYADLWVHNPRVPNNENSIDSSSGSELNRVSNVNTGSNQSVDFADLWVHIPERSNVGVVDHKKSGNWDRARDVVVSIQKKNRDAKLPKPVSVSVSVSNSHQKGVDRGNDVKSEPPLSRSNSKGKTLEPIRTRAKSSAQSSDACVKGENFCGVSSIVSSLVQKWRGYEAESKSLSLVNSPVCGSKVNTELFCAECPSFSDAPSATTPMTNENSFADWESCKTGLSGPSSSVGKDSDATEIEPIRVADIIKKLSSSVEEHGVVHESLPRVKTSCDQVEQQQQQQQQHRTFSPVAQSPRLRGRQVFCDLLMQLEHDRHTEVQGLKECKAVSKFSHKGRIQAMLRLRLLRHGSELKDAHCSRFFRPNTNSKEPAILRKRLNSAQVDQVRGSDMTSQERDSVQTQIETEKTCDASSGSREVNAHQLDIEQADNRIVLEDRNADAASSSEPNQSGGGDINNVIRPSNLVSMNQEHLNLSVTPESTSSDSSTQKSSEFKVDSLQDDGGNSVTQMLEVHIPTVESNNEISDARCDMEEQEDDIHHSAVSECDWTSDVLQHPNEWEELQSDYMQSEDIDQDWINDVSRPRSTWEYLRQARYQEMCDAFQEKEDIRRLLERKSVSSFLSSGLRERIDQLMMARTQTSVKPNMRAIVVENRTRMEEEEEGEEERLPETKIYDRREEEAEEEKRQEECAGCNSDFKEMLNEKMRQKHESSNYATETISWVRDRDNASSDNHSDQIASPYIEGSPLSSTYSQETGRGSSFNNHNSIGIELMYELRGNMEQLRQEVADLRKSVKSCMNMQMEMQMSFKKEAAPKFSHSGRKKRKDAPLAPKFNGGGRCCICYDMQIDTLLYRCGHMCTCFNCAQGLQWSTGKCPVCRAPILDIVQATFHP